MGSSRDVTIGITLGVLKALRRGMGDAANIYEAEVFLAVADDEGTTARDVRVRLGLSKSSVGRYLDHMSSEYRTWNGAIEKGLGLLEQVTDTQDRRRKLLRLTPAGRTLVTTLKRMVRKEVASE